MVNDFQLLDFKIQKLEGINKRQEDDLEQKEKTIEQKELRNVAKPSIFMNHKSILFTIIRGNCS